jgi:MFS family permease
VVLLGAREAPPPAGHKHLERAPLPAAYVRLLIAIGLFGVGDFSRTLLILWATGEKLGLSRTPIALYVLYNIIGAGASFLAGRRSDAIGRKPLLVLAYAIAVGTSCALVFARPALAWAIPVFVASGLYTGILEAVEKAAAADFLPPRDRSWGFAVLATVTGLGDFVSSLVVGLLWQKVGPAAAFGFSAGAMLLGLTLLLGWTSPRSHGSS